MEGQAQRFVEAQGDMSATGVADKLKARDDEIEALKRQDVEKDALIAQLSERMAALEGGQPVKRGPGRPRKNPAPDDQGPQGLGAEKQPGIAGLGA